MLYAHASGPGGLAAFRPQDLRSKLSNARRSPSQGYRGSPSPAAVGRIRGRLCVASALGEGGENAALVTKVKQAGVAMAAALCISAAGLGGGQAAIASDTAAVGACILQSCQRALAGCLADATCVENLVCIQLCQGRPDEADCQVECGNKYSDDAVVKFDTCALTEKKCVPKIEDDGSYPAPPDTAIVKSFDLDKFKGRWYITAGLNKLFDAFDCQEHFFTVPEPGTLYGQINWRVKRDEVGHFLPRTVYQKFYQNPSNPGKLQLDGSQEFLGFVDDWYILGAQLDGKASDYILVYYRGNNDAWSGYGGATVYSRSDKLPKQQVPRIKKELAAAGLDWDKFIVTDNTCGKQPADSAVEKLEKELAKDVVALEKELAKDVVAIEKEVVKDVTGIEKEVVKDVVALEKEVVKDVLAFEREVAKDIPLPEGFKKEFGKDVQKIERVLENDVNAFEAAVTKEYQAIRDVERRAVKRVKGILVEKPKEKAPESAAILAAKKGLVEEMLRETKVAGGWSTDL
eukprot:CAMPEP_0182857786 /NCGR_PEP_ID=MMETSP0034_2-20130328/3249_1 /TAXON_ID=156128 /ORGANISM="Nephroselmis pyriformis, Strain CCMP717" /LENGTH=515 /DNA_ID=CAMNT_0024989063 /DNA_START=126 /DNA_END=1673 /DNA_ORIENTATION=-